MKENMHKKDWKLNIYDEVFLNMEKKQKQPYAFWY